MASSNGHCYDRRYKSADYPAHPIAECKYDWVIIKLAAIGLDEDATDPIKQQRIDQPQPAGMAVESQHLRARHIQRNDKHRAAAGGRAEWEKYAQVFNLVIPPPAPSLPAARLATSSEQRLTIAKLVKKKRLNINSHCV